jgi:molecular chaperone GrpE (heat shock protein)
MKAEKAFLREKLVEFQVRIAELTHALREQEHAFESKEKTLYLGLFEVLDTFETLDENLSAKEEKFDKTSHTLAKNVRSIHRKLVRLLKSSGVVPIEFPDKKAHIDYCKIADTKLAEDMENETILSVVKKGYINKEQGIVLRKAEVVTVLNP